MLKRFTCNVSKIQLSRQVGTGLSALVFGLCQGAGQAHAVEKEEEAAKKAEPAAPAGISVRVSGIIKPEIVYSTGVETFGKNTLVAPTAAAHPLVETNHDKGRSSFQLQQSRFSLHVGEGSGLSGHAEVDFVDADFNRSSPIQGATIRVRLAYMEYQLAEHHMLAAGQQWDIFSPLNPSMMNMVGVAFQAGNSAFLRPQFAYHYTGGPVEVSAAIGSRGQNNSPSVNNLEYSMIPTFALRLAYRSGKTWAGVSAIGSTQLTQLSPRESKPTYAVNAFASLPVGEMVSLNLEGYYGKSTGALGLLTLGNGANLEIQDAGAWISAAVTLAPEHSLWLTAGGALVLDADDVSPGFTAGAAAGDPATRVGINGIERNIALRATYVHTPRKGIEFFLEPFMFMTKHQLDAANSSDEDQTAFGTAFGTRLKF